MTTAVLERPPAAAAVAPLMPDAVAAKYSESENAGDGPAASFPPELPLAGRIHLKLSALGIDPNAPDFGDRLCRLSQDNHPYDFEISAKGELIIMPPSGWESNIGEKGINATLFFWCLEHGGFDASQTVMFRLPSGARYMPDASWITQDRYEQLLASEYHSTIDGAPDFVVEVSSRTDSLAYGLAKMQEWMDGGARLGWYLDPYQIRAYIYRIGHAVEIRDDPETLSGEEVLPGFVFEVRRLIFARYANRHHSQSQPQSESEPGSESEPLAQPEPEPAAEA